MKAVVLEENYRTVVRDIAAPPVADDEVLIRVRSTGICGSDLHAFRGVHAFRKPPVILGHELAGDVVAIGAGVRTLTVGDRVTVMPQVGCGKCRYCREGHSNICPASRVPGAGGWVGTFVEYFNAPAAVVVKLPPHVTYDQGALAEPLAVALHALNKVSPRTRNNLVILGAGTIGLLMAAVAPALGFRKVLATDVLDCKLRLAAALGAAKPVNVRTENLAAAVRETFGGDKADAVVIAAGAPDIIDQAIESVRPQGEIVYVAMVVAPITASSYPVVFWEMTVKGARTYTLADFNQAIDFLAAGKIAFQQLITQRFRLEEAQAGLELLDQEKADACKVMLYT
jgi:Threonine dehydrogenase and related Zn-dependent dehydrogenases